MSQVNESRKKGKEPKRKNNKTIKRKIKVKKEKNVVFVSNCVFAVKDYGVIVVTASTIYLINN